MKAAWGCGTCFESLPPLQDDPKAKVKANTGNEKTAIQIAVRQ